jgi:hypothetical protein
VKDFGFNLIITVLLLNESASESTVRIALLPEPTGTDDHEPVSDLGCLQDLNDLPVPVWMVDEDVLFDSFVDQLFFFLVDFLGYSAIDSECIVQKSLKEWYILSYKFGKVHISQGSHHQEVFIW